MSMAISTNVSVLLSGSGTTFAAIQKYSQSEASCFNVSHVISDNPDAYGLQRAARAGLTVSVVDYHKFASRDEFDKALLSVTKASQPDLVVLAGFMRIVDAQFVATFARHLLNIHPSLLPKYPGLNTHQRALDAHESVHGSTVHFVNNVLDGGPIIAQAIVNIESSDDAESLSARVQVAERILYPKIINWFAQGRLKLINEAVYLDGKVLDQPLLERPGLENPG